MPIVVMDWELLEVLERKRVLFNGQAQFMYLYVNDHTPAHDDTLEDYTPANFHGAGGKVVLWPNAPILDGLGGAILMGQTCIFTPTAGGMLNSVRGYFVIATNGMQLAYAERFTDGPVNIGGDTTPFSVIPYMRERSML